MKIIIAPTPARLGQAAAQDMAEALRAAIAKKGEARLLLSTGASQFDTIAALIALPVDWPRVTMFHLDEYVGLPITHPASFRKYLQERFVDRVPGGLKAVHFVNGEGDVPATLSALEAVIREAPVDVAAIGIGENAHIAFNDPPANFDAEDAFLVVTLDEACRRQQVGEGWFATVDDVPSQAISMSVRQILSSARIFSSVPYAVKAEAVEKTLNAPAVTPDIPATILRTHPDWQLYLDADSASLLDQDALRRQPGVTLDVLD